MNSNLLGGRRILVVEDQCAVALDLCECLDQQGASIIGPALSVADAILILGTAGPLDAAVLDIELEGESVYAVADRLQQLGVHICSPPVTNQPKYRNATNLHRPSRSRSGPEPSWMRSAIS